MTTVYVLYDHANDVVQGVFAQQKDALVKGIRLAREDNDEVPDDLNIRELPDYELEITEADIQY